MPSLNHSEKRTKDTTEELNFISLVPEYVILLSSSVVSLVLFSEWFKDGNIYGALDGKSLGGEGILYHIVKPWYGYRSFLSNKLLWVKTHCGNKMYESRSGFFIGNIVAVGSSVFIGVMQH